MYGYIYRITDLTNGKCYIGQHKYDKPMLDPKYHGSSYILKNQIKKHPENFLEEIIFIAATSDELNYFENYFIEHLNTLYPNGYNLNTGGNKSILCETSREKTSKTLKGRFIGENNPNHGKEGYWKGKEGPNKGKCFTEEWKQKMSKSHKGKIISEETKQKMTEIHISVEELYDLYVVQGLSTIKIANLYGCSSQCIWNKLKKINIKK